METHIYISGCRCVLCSAGFNRSRSGSSSSEKSLRSTSNSASRSTGSAKSIVSSVVRKVQSIGRSKTTSVSPTPSDADLLSASGGAAKPSSAGKPLSSDYPSSALAERLAHHSLPVSENPGPTLSPRLGRSKKTPSAARTNKPSQGVNNRPAWV